jgi:hypothetical protein
VSRPSNEASADQPRVFWEFVLLAMVAGAVLFAVACVLWGGAQ